MSIALSASTATANQRASICPDGQRWFLVALIDDEG